MFVACGLYNIPVIGIDVVNGICSLYINGDNKTTLELWYVSWSYLEERVGPDTEVAAGLADGRHQVQLLYLAAAQSHHLLQAADDLIVHVV